MTSVANTVAELLASAPAERVAFRAPGQDPLTYGGLGQLTGRIADTLRAFGVVAEDKIAIDLPNGAMAASAFLGVAGCAAAAPLNPAYTFDEFKFYIEDLSAKLLICTDIDGASANAARELGVAIAIAVPVPDEMGKAGEFNLDLDLTVAEWSSEDRSSPDDIALVLHTSGTTSRPKIVPLSHRNVTTSGRNIVAALALTSDDACLNLMPLFHIHGLVGVVMTSLSAGSSIFFSPGFNAVKVYAWLDEAKPTWYSAVPTMHQAILARAARNQEIVDAMQLRFIRSSSSSLPPQVMLELTECFGCPVIESYGMTEAAHQMTSNPLGAGQQKPGSVGLPAGPEVRIVAENGEFISGENEGEVVICGNNVTGGYESNEKANQENFFEDNGKRWFRTGDQGRLDADGYLYITGRLKEIINRGGEKISPREVDEVLMDHPAVNQAVAFAVKHDQLGEDIAAAVVLKEGAAAEDKEIREFARERLAGFKVPRKILLLDEIPKGATGKLQRIGLAEKLGLE